LSLALTTLGDSISDMKDISDKRDKSIQFISKICDATYSLFSVY